MGDANCLDISLESSESLLKGFRLEKEEEIERSLAYTLPEYCLVFSSSFALLGLLECASVLPD